MQEFRRQILIFRVINMNVRLHANTIDISVQIYCYCTGIVGFTHCSYGYFRFAQFLSLGLTRAIRRPKAP